MSGDTLSAPTSRPRVLVVDDNPTTVEVIKAYLQREGYAVFEAYHGREAIVRFQECWPDLVLLDVLMPELDGYETCRVLKGFDRGRFVPVVMLTALQATEDKVKGIEAGADDFLSKPFQTVELLARVRSLLKTKRLHDELDCSLEQLQRKNEELQRMERLRDDLIHMIVHDMNNPLTNIVGNLELAMRLPPALSNGQSEAVQLARTATQRLIRMVRNLLEISRMEEGRLDLRIVRGDPQALVTEVAGSSSGLLLTSQAHKLELAIEPATLWYDAELMGRVFANLIDNAVKYSPAGSTIRLMGWLEAEKNVYEFGVSDQAPVIPAEFREAIFEKFRQLESNEAGVRRGSGLGLTFCRLVVQAHGGQIWVEPGPECGNCFRISLPTQPA